MLQQFFKFHYHQLLLGKDEGHIGQVTEQDGSIVNRNILIIAYHIFNYMGNHIQRKKYMVELDYLIISFQICRHFLDYLANIGG